MLVFVFAAAAVAVYFLFKASSQPRTGLFVAALAWLLYAVYEFLMTNGVLCDGTCNIRVDLIAVWPLVWIASLFGIYPRGGWTPIGKLVGWSSFLLLAAMAAVALYGVLVEKPAADRARAESCGAQGKGGPACPPSAVSGQGATFAR